MTSFTPEFVDFLHNLSRKNRRDWFHANKKHYERYVKKPFEDFVGEMIHRVGAVDRGVAIQPREAIFRIARDTRFSKDKTPYKTFMAAVVGPGGRRDMQSPGLYFQFGAGGVLIAGGLYQPERENLFRVRQAIARDVPKLDRALQGKRFTRLFGELRGERNKRLPREFAALMERFPYIANKQFYYHAEYADPLLVLRRNLAEFVMRHYEAGSAVNAFLREAVSA